MQSSRFFYLTIVGAIMVTLAAVVFGTVLAQTIIPTVITVAGQIKANWNIGQSITVPSAGSGAWNSHTDQSAPEIDAAWLEQIKQTVNSAVDYGMHDIFHQP